MEFILVKLQAYSLNTATLLKISPQILPIRHGCISDASLRLLMQRLKDISKKADLQILEMSPVRCFKDVSSETSLRSFRSSQRRL